MGSPLVIGTIAYVAVMIFTMRKIGRAAYYDARPEKRDWTVLLAAITLGLLAALIAPIVLLVIGGETMLGGKADLAARTILGEPKDIRERRLLEAKVKAELRSTHLEREVLED